MKWLVTGGCGFIGRALIADLFKQAEAQSIRVLDNLSTGSRSDLAKIAPISDFTEPGDWQSGLSLLYGDITDLEVVERAVQGADIIVHLAANTGVPQSIEDPLLDCRTNVVGVLNMLEACRKYGVSRFVFASSGAPLGVQTPPLHEEMAPHPASPYGASKLAGEGYCSAYFHSFGIETVALRFGNVYGEGSKHKSSVVAKFIKQALSGKQLEIYGDGSQTRDFIHIYDLVCAIRKAATVPGIGGESFQISTASETTIAELTEKLLSILEIEGLPRPETCFGPARTGDVKRNYSDTSKARELLGWSTKIDLGEGLCRTVRFFIENEEKK